MPSTVRAIRLHEFGSPQVMRLESVELPEPAAGEARVRHSAIGFNFIDIYQRRGTYPLPAGTGLGFEAAGVVEAVGPGVTDVAVGDRVAYMNAGLGAYAEGRNVAADKLVRLPDNVSDEQAAATIFKGMTAQYLVRHTHAVKPGDTVLVHAAAGGVGQILSGWAKALGARVIGTAGSAAKCERARAAGCDVAIDYSHGDWVKQVRDATDGRGVTVVYDGAASGPSPAIDPELLNKKGCLFLTRPSVFPHNADAARFRANAKDLFDAIAAGHVKVDIGARFPLADVAHAHEAAERRETTGAILLLP